MTDLNTNRYLFKQPYPLNQPMYGDNNAALSLDDKKIDAAKDSLKTNAIGKTVVNAIDTADSQEKHSVLNSVKEKIVPSIIGVAATVGLDQLFKTLIKGNSFEESHLGKLARHIDNLSERVPSLKFGWAKNAWGSLKNRFGFIKTIADAPVQKPGLSLVKSMIAPIKNKSVTEFLQEAIKVSKLNPQEAHMLEAVKSAVEDGADGKAIERAFKKACTLTKGNNSKEIQILRNKAAAVMKETSSPLTKMMIKTFNSTSRFFHIGNLLESLKQGKGFWGKFKGTGGTAFATGMFLMNAYFIGEMVKKTWDAPKNEKVSTFAHSFFAEFIAGWLLMDPIVGSAYKGIGALKALGGKGLAKVITKPLNWIGNALSIGLQTPAAKKPASTVQYLTFPFRKGFEFVKKIAGGASRFYLIQMGMFGMTEKAARFVTHGIFGKPEALLAKEKAEEAAGVEPTPESNMANLTKALDQNKGMITVAAKSQMNPPPAGLDLLNNASSPIESQPAAKSLNENKQHQYIPADTRKVEKPDKEKQDKFNKELAKADSAMHDAEKLLKAG